MWNSMHSMIILYARSFFELEQMSSEQSKRISLDLHINHSVWMIDRIVEYEGQWANNDKRILSTIVLVIRVLSKESERERKQWFLSMHSNITHTLKKNNPMSISLNDPISVDWISILIDAYISYCSYFKLCLSCSCCTEENSMSIGNDVHTLLKWPGRVSIINCNRDNSVCNRITCKRNLQVWITRWTIFVKNHT
jgi:hypothetical protein